LDWTYLFSFPTAHRYDGTIVGWVRLPAFSRRDNAPELAAKSRVVVAVPDFAQRVFENVAQRAALQDAARRDGTAGADDERVPSDEARLIEAGALVIDAAAAARSQLMGNLLAPRQISAHDEVREPPPVAA